MDGNLLSFLCHNGNRQDRGKNLNKKVSNQGEFKYLYFTGLTIGLLDISIISSSKLTILFGFDFLCHIFSSLFLFIFKLKIMIFFNNQFLLSLNISHWFWQTGIMGISVELAAILAFFGWNFMGGFLIITKFDSLLLI